MRTPQIMTAALIFHASGEQIWPQNALFIAAVIPCQTPEIAVALALESGWEADQRVQAVQGAAFRTIQPGDYLAHGGVVYQYRQEGLEVIEQASTLTVWLKTTVTLAHPLPEPAEVKRRLRSVRGVLVLHQQRQMLITTGFLLTVAQQLGHTLGVLISDQEQRLRTTAALLNLPAPQTVKQVHTGLTWTTCAEWRNPAQPFQSDPGPRHADARS